MQAEQLDRVYNLPRLVYAILPPKREQQLVGLNMLLRGKVSDDTQ